MHGCIWGLSSLHTLTGFAESSGTHWPLLLSVTSCEGGRGQDQAALCTFMDGHSLARELIRMCTPIANGLLWGAHAEVEEQTVLAGDLRGGLGLLCARKYNLFIYLLF